MSRRAGLAPLALAAALGAAAPAGAARIATSPCVRYLGGAGRYVTVAGSGFTPGKAAGVILRWSSGDRAAALGTSPAGTFLARIAGPEPLLSSPVGFERTYTLTAEDGTDSALTASRRVTLVHAGLTAQPSRTRPRGFRTYRFYGFPDGRPLYAHFVHGGRILRTLLLGRTHGACGRLAHRMRLIPSGTRVRLGRWTILFSNARRSTRSSTLASYPFRIFRTFRF